MDKTVKESIQKFEEKNKFREVKLKTRDSFKEDQAALNHRLSKYQTISTDPGGDDTDLNVTSNNASKTVQNGEKSNLENIVMDLNQEKKRLRSRSTESGHSQNGHTSAGSETSNSNDRQYENLIINSRERTGSKSSVSNGMSPTGSVSGSEDGGQTKPPINGQVKPPVNDHAKPPINGVAHGKPPVPNGSVLNGKPRVSVKSLMNGEVRGSMTPEPRLKFPGRIYEKNPRLTAGSTDHLDNISLRGSRPHPHHGHRIVEQPSQVYERVVPGSEVTCIPADGNLCGFGVEQMVTVFRMLKINEDAIYRLNRGRVDGKRFALFSDKELEDIGIKNPIVKYFRDKSFAPHARPKKKNIFML